MQEFRTQIQQYLEPWQFAVGIKGGQEQMTAQLQTQLATHPQQVLIKLDSTNAFNKIDRQKTLDEVATGFPCMIDFFWQFYGEPSEIWYDTDTTSHTLYSQEGTQQGDPAGPLLFSVGLHPALKKIAAQPCCSFETAYLDDVCLGSGWDQAGEMFALAQREFAQVGVTP